MKNIKTTVFRKTQIIRGRKSTKNTIFTDIDTGIFNIKKRFTTKIMDRYIEMEH